MLLIFRHIFSIVRFISHCIQHCYWPVCFIMLCMCCEISCDVCVWFDIKAHMSVPCHEGPPATKGHFSSEPAVAGRGRYYCSGNARLLARWNLTPASLTRAATQVCRGTMHGQAWLISNFFMLVNDHLSPLTAHRDHVHGQAGPDPWGCMDHVKKKASESMPLVY